MGESQFGNPQLTAVRQRQAIDFLRGWLPEEAKQTYRQMIREDPLNWSRHPHFAGGIIVEFALRGNGINERTLGVRNLDALWPDLLRAALELQGEDAASA